MKEIRLYQAWLALLIVASVPALFGAVMEPDSALYASIAKNMVLRGDWLNLYVRGADWLDKPHLPFWIAAFSFKIFGVSAFAYKLPSFLGGLVGAWYSYKFAKALYNERIAWLTPLIYLSAVHVLISTYDVRAEVYITTFTFAALYHYYRAQFGSFWHLLAGSLATACAIMTKGIFVLITILGGIILYWLFTRQLRQLLKPKWWLALLLVGLFIVPELYSLYAQFDLHPEKIVFGEHHVSGLKFFVWDSQFGRFFNNGPIKGKGDLFFFFHTLLWAFLPWCFLFYTGVFELIRNRQAVQKKGVLIIWLSAGITFLLFSLSKFQLPHYIILVLPQFAMITAAYVDGLTLKEERIFTIIQKVVFVLIMLCLLILTFVSQFQWSFILMALLITVGLCALFLSKGNKSTNLVGISVTAAIVFMVFVSFYFYPGVLRYEAGKEAAMWLNRNKPMLKSAVYQNGDSFSFDFYAKEDPIYFWSGQALDEYGDKQKLALYVQAQLLPELQQKYRIKILKDFDYYHTTRLSAHFLNVKTRSQTLEKYYLVKID